MALLDRFNMFAWQNLKGQLVKMTRDQDGLRIRCEELLSQNVELESSKKGYNDKVRLAKTEND